MKVELADARDFVSRETSAGYFRRLLANPLSALSRRFLLQFSFASDFYFRGGSFVLAEMRISLSLISANLLKSGRPVIKPNKQSKISYPEMGVDFYLLD